MATIVDDQHPLLHWWRNHVVATIDHVRVVEKVQDEAGWSGRYAFMVIMSAGIAVLGLLLSSPAVVIGAMLISPLMGPIIGLGFALATFDSREIRRAVVALGGGTVLAVLFCALVVVVSPLQNVTSEIAARTRPNLFDLMVALFSALAGAYAMIRGREGTIVGVAIATALMPPLAVIGFGLATTNWTVFLGASLLFFTNLMTIALAAAVMARLFGFAADLSPNQTLLQSVLIVAIFVGLAIPLGFTLRQVAWEALAGRQAREVVSTEFGDNARVDQVEVDFHAKPLKVSATVLTPDYKHNAERQTADELTRMLGQPVTVALEQYRVGTGAGDAEAAQIASAQQADANRRAATKAADAVAARLALIAGVSTDAVLIDRDTQRAVVRAEPLPGATLGAYRMLESRVAAGASDWQVSLIPPPIAPSPVSFDGDAPDANGRAALGDAVWAARRLNLPLGVRGTAARAKIVTDALNQAGVAAERTGSKSGDVALEWQARVATPPAPAPAPTAAATPTP